MNDKKILDMYLKQNKSTYEIAEALNTYPNKIRRVLIKNNIELKTKSEAQKNAIKSGVAKHPTLGKKRTQEEKLKISYSLKKYWDDMSEELYAKKIQSSKDRWNNLSDTQKNNILQLASDAIRVAGKEGSKLEKFLYKELTVAGYRVDFHKKQLIQNQNLEIDMYIPSLKTIIEVDGPSHFLPIWGEEKLQKQIKADLDKSGLILSKDMLIIRIKNLSDTLSLYEKEKLRVDILKILDKIKNKFPPKSERYIELEI